MQLMVIGTGVWELRNVGREDRLQSLKKGLEEIGSPIARTYATAIDGGEVEIHGNKFYVPARQVEFAAVISPASPESDPVLRVKFSPMTVKCAIFADRKGGYKTPLRFFEECRAALAKAAESIWRELVQADYRSGTYTQINTDDRLSSKSQKVRVVCRDGRSRMIKVVEVGLGSKDYRRLLQDWSRETGIKLGQKQVPLIGVSRYPVGDEHGCQWAVPVELPDVLAGKLYLNHFVLARMGGDEDGDGAVHFRSCDGETGTWWVAESRQVDESPMPVCLITAGFVQRMIENQVKDAAESDPLNEVLGMMVKSLVGFVTTSLCTRMGLYEASAMKVEENTAKAALPTELVEMLSISDLELRVRTISLQAILVVAKQFVVILEGCMDAHKRDGVGLPALKRVIGVISAMNKTGITTSQFRQTFSPLLDENQEALEAMEKILAVADSQTGGVICFQGLQKSQIGAAVGSQTPGEGLLQGSTLDLVKEMLNLHQIQDVGSFEPPTQLTEKGHYGFCAGRSSVELVSETSMLDVQQCWFAATGQPQSGKPVFHSVEPMQGGFNAVLVAVWEKSEQKTCYPVVFRLPKTKILPREGVDKTVPEERRWLTRLLQVGNATYVWHPRICYRRNGSHYWQSFPEWLREQLVSVVEKFSKETGWATDPKRRKMVAEYLQKELEGKLRSLPVFEQGTEDFEAGQGCLVVEIQGEKRLALEEELDRKAALLQFAMGLDRPKIGSLGISITSKSAPGTRFHFLTEAGEVSGFEQQHPLMRLDPSAPKRRAELNPKEAIKLANRQGVADALAQAHEVEPGTLEEVYARLPEEIRKRLEWVLHLRDPRQGLAREGAPRNEFLRERTTTVRVAIGTVPGVNSFYDRENPTAPPECCDSIVGCPSVLLKLALSEVEKKFTSEARAKAFVQGFLDEGIPERAIKVTVEETGTGNWPIPQYRVVVNYPHLDAGKVKLGSPFKGVLKVIPFQLYDETGREIDIVVPEKTALKKGGLGTILTMLANEAGVASINPLDETGKSLRSGQSIAEEILGGPVKPETGIQTVSAVRVNVHEPRSWPTTKPVEAVEIGKAFVGESPCWRPPQTVGITNNTAHQCRIGRDSMSLMDPPIIPNFVGDTRIQELIGELSELQRSYASLNEAERMWRTENPDKK